MNWSKLKLNPERVPVGVAPPFAPKLEEFLSRINHFDQIQIVQLDSLKDVVPFFEVTKGGIWMAHVPDRPNLVEVLATLRVMRPLMSLGSFRVLATVLDRNPLVIRKLIDFGASEALVEPASAKTLEMKMMRLAHQLLGHQEKSQKSKVIESQTKKTISGTSKLDRTAEKKVIWMPPIKPQSECWLVQGGSVRRAMGRWISTMLGPSPGAGGWKLDGSLNSDEEGNYLWVPGVAAGQPESFMHTQGEWWFFGKKPEFRTDNWTFMGKTPELKFVSPEGVILASKIWVDMDLNIMVARDSEWGLKNVHKLKRSLELYVHLKKEKSKEGALNVQVQKSLPADLIQRLKETPDVSESSRVELDVIAQQVLTREMPSVRSVKDKPRPQRALGVLTSVFILSELVAHPWPSRELFYETLCRSFEKAAPGCTVRWSQERGTKPGTQSLSLGDEGSGSGYLVFEGTQLDTYRDALHSLQNVLHKLEWGPDPQVNQKAA